MKIVHVFFKWILIFCIIGIQQFNAQTNVVIQPTVGLLYESQGSDTSLSFFDIQNNAEEFFRNYHNLNGPAIPRIEKVYKRWEYFWRNKVTYPFQPKNGDLGAHNFYKHALTTHQLNVCTTPIGNPWSLAGIDYLPRQEIGIVQSMAINPDNTNILFAGSYTSGLWRSMDAGANWENITDYLNLPSMGVRSIAINKTNPNEMFIATGGGYQRSGSNYAYGLFKSTNGGNTWTQVLTNNQILNGLVIDINKSFEQNSTKLFKLL
jgi:hypothetical protein